MAAPLPVLLAEQLGARLAGLVNCFWPQIMASAREHLVPWVDRNAPELATPARLAFLDLGVVADDLQHAVRGAWWRLRDLLVGQSAQLVVSGNGDWAVRVTSRLRCPAADGVGIIELTTEERLRLGAITGEIPAGQLEACRGASIDIVRIRDHLLSDTA
jgi:hypothetical protein